MIKSTKLWVRVVILGAFALLLPRLGAEIQGEGPGSLKAELTGTLKDLLAKTTITRQRLELAKAILTLNPEDTGAAEILVFEGLNTEKSAPPGREDAVRAQAAEDIRELIRPAPPALIRAMIGLLKNGGPGRPSAIQLISSIDADALDQAGR